jgi:hypothetical protein
MEESLADTTSESGVSLVLAVKISKHQFMVGTWKCVAA